MCITSCLSIYLLMDILGSFHVLANVSSAAMNIRVHVCFQIMVLSGYMARSGICVSYGILFLVF